MLIEQSLTTGKSPVERAGYSTNPTGRKYKKYSDSYKDQIRKGRVRGKSSVTPVNLKATGKMRRSLKGRPTLKGILLFYTSPIAKYHNDLGAGRSKVVRQILPRDEQKFARPIEKSLTDLYTKIFNQIK